MSNNVIDATLRFVDKFSSPMQNAVKQMQNSAKKAQRMGKDISKVGDSISKTGSKLTATLTLPIVGLGVAAIKASNDFETSMAKVSTIADTTAVPLSTLKDQVLDLSNTYGTGFTDIAEAQYQAISAGVDTVKSAEFVGTAIKAAKGGFTDTTTAVNGLTNILNAYGKGAEQATNISDQMLVAQNYGKTSFGELATSMGKVTPIASSLNISTEELFSSIAVLTKNGIATSESVTGLKAAYSNILKPSAEATKTAEKLGLQFNSAHLQSVGWAKFLEEIKEKTGGNVETMGKLFGSTEALNGIMVLTGSGSKDFSTAMGLMADSTGATQSAYEKMITPQERMNISINKVKNSAIQFGTALTPVFEKVSETIGKLADKFNGLSDEQVDMIIKIAGVIAVVGPSIVVLGKLTSGVGKTVENFGKLGKALKGAGSIFGLITSPAFLVVGAIVAIAAIVYLVIKNWDKLKAYFSKFVAFLKKTFTKSGGDVNKFGEIFNRAKDTVKLAIDKFKPIFNNIIKFLKPIINFVKDVFVNYLKVGFSSILGIVSGVVDGIAGYVNGIITVIQGIVLFITGVFSGDWAQAWEGVKTIFRGIFESLGALLKTPINAIIGMINGAIGGINKLGLTIPDWIPGGLGGKTFSINVPTMPFLAKGTDNWRGGLAVTQDKGGEIMDLPKGTRVYPHDKSIDMARQEGAKSAGNVNITIPKFADSIVIKNDNDIDKLAKKLAYEIKSVFYNTGEVVLT